MAKTTNDHETVATNRKAGFNYFLEDRLEAGLVLIGSEIKAIRAHKVNLSEGFIEERGGELWLMDVHISEYKEAAQFGHKPTRPRKLLLKKKEINRLMGRVREKGYTIIPTVMYLKNGRAKVEIALAKGKKQYDKRDSIAERETGRVLKRALKEGRYED
ncbi:MAG: SsrA-binding protein SmpB [Anaerolineales bacterium]|nr:SsrA-binding protein SmpB [Anaerolineales bacterium]